MTENLTPIGPSIDGSPRRRSGNEYGRLARGADGVVVWVTEFTDPELVPLPAQTSEEHADEQAAGNDRSAFPYVPSREGLGLCDYIADLDNTGTDTPVDPRRPEYALALLCYMADPHGSANGYGETVFKALTTRSRGIAPTGEQWDDLTERLSESLDEADTHYAFTVVRTWMGEVAR